MMNCEMPSKLSTEIMQAEQIAVGPLRSKAMAEVVLPGSKSYSNRALVLAALAEGKSEVTGVSASDDSQAMLKALQQLGCVVTEIGDKVQIDGAVGRNLPSGEIEINVGPAGTTMRFLLALVAALPGAQVILSGSERMHQRPIADLVDALRELGANIEYLGTEGCPPLKVIGQSLQTSQPIKISGKTSSQFISALLLASPLIKGGLNLEIQGDLVSKSYIDMTISGMAGYGLAVANQNYQKLSTPADQLVRICSYHVEGDASGASYFWALAALTGGAIRVSNISSNSAQGDVNFPKLLEQMGCTYRSHSGASSSDSWIEISREQALKPIDVNMELMPDTAQTLAMVAACALGTSKLTGLQTLKVKETDRLLALQTEFAKLGINCEIGADYLQIQGQVVSHLPQTVIETYEDHRMAMSYAILAAAHGPFMIAEPAVVSKSFPTFWSELLRLGVAIKCV